MSPLTTRLLVASPLADVVREPLERLLEPAIVISAGSPDEVRQALKTGLRFDAVLTDLVSNAESWGFGFDGLDVLSIVRQRDPGTPLVYALHSEQGESEHVAELTARGEATALVLKTQPLVGIADVLRDAVSRPGGAVRRRPGSALYDYFSSGQRGVTAGRLAGAIAAGRASDTESLAAAASVSSSTAEKLAGYLRPIMVAREEHRPELRLTSASVYRWCGLHARYLTSWCRRHGHEDVLGIS
ncbi:hypothetical protein BH09ACT12_BH09ACT12_25930 [soil metagenome]